MTNVAMLEPSRWGGKSLPGQDELPSDDGETLETPFHHAQGCLLIDSLVSTWSARRDFYVAGSMFIYFSEHQIRSNDFRGPDVFVVLDTERKGRKSWVAWEEGGKLPDVVVEIVSDSTAAVARGEKKRIYARVWRTPAYFIFDPETSELEAYRLDVDHLEYVPITPDARGDFPVPGLGLSMGLRWSNYRDWDRLYMRWIDADGNPLLIGDERADHERKRADDLAKRVRELEARGQKVGDPSE
jgi:Uma2 family endonuclease